MPVVTLAAASAAAPMAQPLPVVVRLSLAELLLISERCGRPRLPLDLEARHEPEQPDRLQQRLAGGEPSNEIRARDLIGAEHALAAEAPSSILDRLSGMGLLDQDGTPVGDVVAALEALAAPEALVILDLVVRHEGADEARLRSYFAVVGDRVVQLSTVSGLTFELAWFPAGGLGEALTRAATLEDFGEDPEGAAVTARLELPFELFTDGTEAVRRGREDLLAELVRLAPGPVMEDGVELSPARGARLITALEQSVRGRLRVLVAAPREDDGRRTTGVVSWLLTDGGWRELTPRTVDGVPLVGITSVEAHDLARSVAPVLAQVVR